MYIYSFICGCCLFSFFNVAFNRIRLDENFVTSRSYCDHCHHILTLMDTIPLLSQLANKSCCRYCHHHYSWSYFVIELIGGISGLYFATTQTSFYTLWWFCFLINCLILSLEDWYHCEITLVHWWLPLSLWITCGYFFFHYSFYIYSALIYWLFATLFYYPIRTQIGYGDILFITTLILIFGFYRSLYIICIASILGIITYIIRQLDKQSAALPFIPLLSIATCLVGILLN